MHTTEAAPSPGAIVYSIPHLKAMILYKFGGLQHPVTPFLGGVRYDRARHNPAEPSVFAVYELAAALADHASWTVDTSYASIGRPYECAEMDCWAPSFPGHICDQALLQGRTRADLSDVLLQMAWRGGPAPNWEHPDLCLTGEMDYHDTFEGSRLWLPRAWDVCGIGLSLSMPRTALLAIALTECPPDAQPDPCLSKADIVRHILKH